MVLQKLYPGRPIDCREQLVNQSSAAQSVLGLTRANDIDGRSAGNATFSFVQLLRQLLDRGEINARVRQTLGYPPLDICSVDHGTIGQLKQGANNLVLVSIFESSNLPLCKRDQEIGKRKRPLQHSQCGRGLRLGNRQVAKEIIPHVVAPVVKTSIVGE